MSVKKVLQNDTSSTKLLINLQFPLNFTFLKILYKYSTTLMCGLFLFRHLIPLFRVNILILWQSFLPLASGPPTIKVGIIVLSSFPHTHVYDHMIIYTMLRLVPQIHTNEIVDTQFSSLLFSSYYSVLSDFTGKTFLFSPHIVISGHCTKQRNGNETFNFVTIHYAWNLLIFCKTTKYYLIVKYIFIN